MKDKIFLIWSGNNAVAKKIKNILENNYNYICYVGGNSNNDSALMSIGDTVIHQMRNCNQAIVLFQNKENGGISNNLFFELGYVSASYGMKKVHCVRRNDENILLPSDFDNAFVEVISAENDDDYAEKIVSYFLSRQKLSVDINKMYLINNRHQIHELLQAHYSESGSKCSDYELAQYVLFYTQASVMLQDEKRVLNELKEFKKMNSSQFSEELSQSVNISIAFLEFQTNLISEGDVVYIADSVFRKYFNACNDVLDEIADDNVGTFDEWIKMIVSENLAYAFSLYSQNPNIEPAEKTYLCNKVIACGEKALQYISVLEERTPSIENNDRVGLIALFKAYVYHHMYLASVYIKSDDIDKWLKLSLRERRNLLRNFDNGSIDTKIYLNFEMEYYLNLVEMLNGQNKAEMNEFEYRMYLKDIDTFIEQFQNYDDTSAFVKKIIHQRKNLG